MPRIRIRAHPPPLMMKSGRGVPPLYDHLINAPDDSDSNPEEELDEEWKRLTQVSEQWRKKSNISAFHSFCKQVLGIEEFREPSDERESGGHKHHSKRQVKGPEFDMGATDKYVEGIKLHREIIAEECMGVQQGYQLLEDQLVRLCSSIPRFSRHVYHGNEKAHMEAASSIPLFEWMLTHEDIPSDIRLLTLISISEMLHCSKRLKRKFAECHGSQVLIRFMSQVEEGPLLACWACYCLTTASINCVHVIAQAKKQEGIKEITGEMSFDSYWSDWPVNYGRILRSILFGPKEAAQPYTPPPPREAEAPGEPPNGESESTGENPPEQQLVNQKPRKHSRRKHSKRKGVEQTPAAETQAD